MPKGMRVFLTTIVFFLLIATVLGKDRASNGAATAPPVAPQKPVVDTIQSHRIVDQYRWLEDSASPETQKWVSEELAYTRGLLDPLPGREQLHKRLTELMSIGSLSAPQIAGKYYFYTKREGTQNQPVLLVRERVHGEDRVLLDVNKLVADGTLALDWWAPSDDGKCVTYGTSPSGSEISTLHILETATGKALPDTIERTRAASIAWKLDNSGFFYTRYPKKGDVPEGEEVYHRRVFYHALGSDSTNDPLVFGKDLGAEDWPGVDL
jgi:prolyl oligopeptidase